MLPAAINIDKTIYLVVSTEYRVVSTIFLVALAHLAQLDKLEELGELGALNSNR